MQIQIQMQGEADCALNRPQMIQDSKASSVKGLVKKKEHFMQMTLKPNPTQYSGAYVDCG